jgi:nucleoid-associated protein YgaU
MSFFKKDDPKQKADFSNVSSGSSTSGNRPAPSPPAGGVAKPDFSNVRSGSSSTAPTIPSPGGSPASSYVVKSGDSLSKIARRIYGDAKKWPRIYEANKDLIGSNPDLIQPGQNLVIPQD